MRQQLALALGARAFSALARQKGAKAAVTVDGDFAPEEGDGE